MTAAQSTLQPEVVVGVDAHKDAYHAAVLTSTGELLGDKQFEVNSAGYSQLRNWAGGFGEVAAFAVESTGSEGAGLARFLVEQGCDVREVNTPHAHAKARRGKTDALDAEAAARKFIAGDAVATPKTTTGAVTLHSPRSLPRLDQRPRPPQQAIMTTCVAPPIADS